MHLLAPVIRTDLTSVTAFNIFQTFTSDQRKTKRDKHLIMTRVHVLTSRCLKRTQQLFK